MAAHDDLEMKLLAGEDLETALALAESIEGLDDPHCEAWGVPLPQTALRAGKGWGVFVKGTLAAALWITGNPDGVGDVVALAVPRRRWGSGLTTWMLVEIGKVLGKHGCKKLRIILTAGNGFLAEALEDAGFKGPTLRNEGYPAGEWTRAVQGKGGEAEVADKNR